MIKKILVPVDYSECSRAALEFAVELAQKNAAELDIVHAWDRPMYISDSIVVHQQDGSKRSLVDMIRENAEHEMAAFLSESKIPAGVRFRARLAGGSPASTLLRELERGEHDLVVTGTHGRTGLNHLLIGSVAEKLVRLSPVPVITVPLPAANRKRP